MREHSPFEPQPSTVVVKYATRRALLSFVEEGPAGIRLFAPLGREGASLQLRAPVRLKVTFGDCARNFQVEGRVASEPERNAGTLGRHILIRTPEERRGFTHVQAFCAQNKEAPRRIEVWLPCTLRTGGEALQGHVRDVSLGGIFIAGASLPKSLLLTPRATFDVVFRQGLFGWSSLVLPAQVVWAGEKNGLPGIGAAWRGTGTQAQVLALLRRHGGR